MAANPAGTVFKYPFLILGGIVILLLSMACGGSDEPSPEKQKQTFCNDLSDLSSSVKSLGTAVTSLDRSNIEDALNKVEDNVKDVKSSGKKIRSSNSGQIETAYDNLKSSAEAVKQAGVGAAVSSGAVATFSSSLSTFVNTVANSLSQYECGKT